MKVDVFHVFTAGRLTCTRAAADAVAASATVLLFNYHINDTQYTQAFAWLTTKKHK